MTTYKIIRMFKNGNQRIIKRGLTLNEAQAHCRLESTHKKDSQGNVIWFDGYDEEKGSERTNKINERVKEIRQEFEDGRWVTKETKVWE
jgi:hypothetical protein